MTSRIPPPRSPRPVDEGPVEVPFKWPAGLAGWARRYFLAHVVEFVRGCDLTARNQRRFTTLCRCYAERVDAERLAARFSRRRSFKGRRDFYALERGVFKCLDRERRILAELGLPKRRDLHQ